MNPPQRTSSPTGAQPQPVIGPTLSPSPRRPPGATEESTRRSLIRRLSERSEASVPISGQRSQPNTSEGAGHPDHTTEKFAKDPRLGYYVFENGFEDAYDFTKYRKAPDTELFGVRSFYGEEPVEISNNNKHLFYRSATACELVRIQVAATPGLRSYHLKQDQIIKVVSEREGNVYPTATGTSRPDVVCVTDGMAVCTGVVIAAISPDKETAKIKVIHIQPDANLKAVEAIETYLSKLTSMGLSEIKVAMHGGNFYKPHQEDKITREKNLTERLRGLFNQPNITVELDEVADKRGQKNTCLGAVIETSKQEGRTQLSVQIFNELVAPPHQVFTFE
jgi:hypothetical protein